MTILSVSLMWAIVLFGVLLWTTACVVLNAALRRGMGIMGLVLSYAVLGWMVFALPWREVVATWGVFAALGGVLTVGYELWARRRYRETGRTPRPVIRLEGILLWPSLIPDAVGQMLNDAGFLGRDERAETHQEDWKRVTGEMPTPRR